MRINALDLDSLDDYFKRRLIEEQALADCSAGPTRDMHLRACDLIRELLERGLPN